MPSRTREEAMITTNSNPSILGLNLKIKVKMGNHMTSLIKR
jgi:hypothetical protein